MKITPHLFVNIVVWIVLAISVLVIIGYIIDDPALITWTGLPMALHAAMCFFLISCVLLIINNKRMYDGNDSN